MRSWKNVNPNSREFETLVRILISFLLILQDLDPGFIFNSIFNEILVIIEFD